MFIIQCLCTVLQVVRSFLQQQFNSRITDTNPPIITSSSSTPSSSSSGTPHSTCKDSPSFIGMQQLDSYFYGTIPGITVKEQFPEKFSFICHMCQVSVVPVLYILQVVYQAILPYSLFSMLFQSVFLLQSKMLSVTAHSVHLSLLVSPSVCGDCVLNEDWGLNVNSCSKYIMIFCIKKTLYRIKLILILISTDESCKQIYILNRILYCHQCDVCVSLSHCFFLFQSVYTNNIKFYNHLKFHLQENKNAKICCDFCLAHFLSSTYLSIHLRTVSRKRERKKIREGIKGEVCSVH